MLQSLAGSLDGVFGRFAGTGVIFVLVVGGIFFLEFVIIISAVFATLIQTRPRPRPVPRR